MPVLVQLVWLGPALAEITQNFAINQPVVSGTIVSLDSHNNHLMNPATPSNVQSLFGVTVGEVSAGSVEVATTGEVATLVSDINGDIAPGDAITISDITGIGAKAVSGRVLGVAQGGFSASSPGAVTEKVNGVRGVSRQISIGRISVVIGPQDVARGGSSVSQSVQKLFVSAAGHDVSSGRVALSISILAVVMILVVSMVAGAIRNSLNSIGRNPLAGSSIVLGLSQVLGLAVLVLAIAFVGVFIIIKT